MGFLGAYDLIKKFVIDQQKTVIMTTHQLNFAAEIADRLVLIDQGKIMEVRTTTLGSRRHSTL